MRISTLIDKEELKELERLAEIGKATTWWLDQCDFDLDYTITQQGKIDSLLDYYREAVDK